MQIIVCCFLLLSFFSQETTIKTIIIASQPEKILSFESNNDSPFHELNSDQSVSQSTVILSFRILKVGQLSFCQKEYKTPIGIKRFVKILPSLFICNNPVETIQLRC